MTWIEIASYAAAIWFAVLGLWCLLRYFRSHHDDWLGVCPEEFETTAQIRERLMAQAARMDRARNFSEPSAKSAEAFSRDRVIHRMPPKDAA